MKSLRRRTRRNANSSSDFSNAHTSTTDGNSNSNSNRNNRNLEEAYERHLRNKNSREQQSEKSRNKQEDAIPIPINILLAQDSSKLSEFPEDDNNKQYTNSTDTITTAPGLHHLTTCNDSKTNNEINYDDKDPQSKNRDPSSRSQMATSTSTAAIHSIKKDESRLKKIFIRLFFGFLMVFIFLSHMYMGHIYLCGLIFFTEVMLFRELVKVRYNTFFHIIEETIPLFRTTQWLWFWTAIFFAYSDFVVDVIKGNTNLHYLLEYAKFHTGFSFLLYSGTFVLTIATMQKGYIRFQINQLCWTCFVLCLTVGQLKYIMQNVYNGLFWFCLPIMLVVSNDSFAWLAGITCGRKFVHREFISFSPNKTWEGFIGGWIGTMMFGWHLARFMAGYTWMICPATTFSVIPQKLECEPNPVFQPATHIVPSQIFELLPYGLAQMIPGVVNICEVVMGGTGAGAGVGAVNENDFIDHEGSAASSSSLMLTACISGEPSHTHHHFELMVKNVYPVQIHALGLGLFASFVAPFGGFLASAIKRAYGLKDFASFIPGHGGMMDRMDCQLLMALCTWVHYNTFVKMATVSVPKMIYMYKLMSASEQSDFLTRIGELEE